MMLGHTIARGYDTRGEAVQSVDRGQPAGGGGGRWCRPSPGRGVRGVCCLGVVCGSATTQRGVGKVGWVFSAPYIENHQTLETSARNKAGGSYKRGRGVLEKGGTEK